MRPNAVRTAFAAGRPVINAWLSTPSGFVAEVAGSLGFDAVTVDLQHGLIGFETAVGMFQAISATAATPLARVSHNEPAAIMRLLDAGAYGVICPMISSVEQAKAFVAAVRYPPIGSRSFGPARGLLYGGADYASHANDEVLALAMIETVEGVANREAILAVDGIDGVYVGPNDLALDMGFAPQPEHPERSVVAAIDSVRTAAAAAGKICGIFCSGGVAAARRIGEGFDLVTPGNDIAALRLAWSAAIATCKDGGPASRKVSGY